MNHILEPLNENQEMNCFVEFKGTKAGALAKAGKIVQALSAVLTGCSIGCRVSWESRLKSIIADEEDPGVIVFFDGQVPRENL